MDNILVYFPFTYPWIIRHLLGNSKTVLDIGCGDGSFMIKINRDKKYEVTGVDLYKPDLKQAKQSGAYKKIISSDIRKIKFQNKSFDAVLSSQVIEHLNKKDALNLIKKLERFTKCKVILSTPNGFVKYDPFEVINNNKLQEHKSGWKIKEMEELGYKVFGQGSKFIYRSEGPLYKFRRFKNIFAILSYLLSPFIYFFPERSFIIVAIKKNV